MLLAQASHVAGQPGRPLEDLVVEAVGTFGHADVLFERLAHLDHLLEDRGRPIGDPAGRGGGDRLLQVDQGVVEGLAALPCGIECRGDLLVVHRATLAEPSDGSQAGWAAHP